jgi:anti-sigma regulatory factor (Ser/Thr protein kinase)
MRELSLHILDILQNAVEAGATRVKLTIAEDLAADCLTIIVQDNGRGIPPEKLPHLFDPFYTTRKTRHVGLGLPLVKAAAKRCGGDVSIVSEVGAGATVTASFQHSHLDRAPLGDITGTLMSFILGGACDLRYVHRVSGSGETDGREFAFDTAEMRAELGDVPLSHPDVRDWLKRFITEGEGDLR